MNKNIKKLVAAGMLGSMLVTVNANAEELGNVKLAQADYPMTHGIVKYTNDEEEFLNDLFGDVYVKEDNNNTPQVVESKEEETTTYNEADETVSSYFDAEKGKLKKYLESEDYEMMKKEAKKMFTEGIDFLFFDGEIDGFTREQMTEQGKIDIMNTIEGTGEFLDEYFPGFSDSFGAKYSAAKEFLGEKSVAILDKVKEWIGEDTYEGVSNMGRDFIENLGVLGDLLGDKYQEWKLK